MFNERPIVAAIHSSLVEELKARQRIMEEETGRKTRGGLTCFSEMAAHELKSIRLSGDQLMLEIFKIKRPPIKKIIENGIEKEFVPYEYFKKLYIYSSILNKKKDQQQIHVEVSKLKGLQKNEVKYIYKW